MNAREVGEKYVALCKENECLATLFSKDAVSVAAIAPPGGRGELAVLRG